MTSYFNTFGGAPVQSTDDSYNAITVTGTKQLYWPSSQLNTTDIIAALNSVVSSADTDSIILDDATLVSVGQNNLFVNLGEHSVVIKSFGGAEIVTIAAGDAYLVFVSDNTTTAGTYITFPLGAGTFGPVASQLAGAGLTVIDNKLAVNEVSVTIPGVYTITAADRAKALYYTGGSNTWVLPTPESIGLGFECDVINASQAAGVLTLDGGGSLINIESSLRLNPSDSLKLIAVGNGLWGAQGFGRQIYNATGYLAKSLAGAPATITLTASECNNQIISFYGTLTNNVTVLFQPIVNSYWLDNLTDAGPYTVSVQLATGGNLYLLPRNTLAFNIISDAATLRAVQPMFYDATFITQTPNASLPNSQALSALGSGILKNTTGTGVQVLAQKNIDYYQPGGLSSQYALSIQQDGPNSSIVNPCILLAQVHSFGTVDPGAGLVIWASTDAASTLNFQNSAGNFRCLASNVFSTGTIMVANGSTYVPLIQGADNTYLGVTSGVLQYSIPPSSNIQTYDAILTNFTGGLSGTVAVKVAEIQSMPTSNLYNVIEAGIPSNPRAILIADITLDMQILGFAPGDSVQVTICGAFGTPDFTSIPNQYTQFINTGSPTNWYMGMITVPVLLSSVVNDNGYLEVWIKGSSGSLGGTITGGITNTRITIDTNGLL